MDWVERLAVLVFSVKNSPTCSGAESVISYAVLLRFSCHGSGHCGDARLCPVKRDNGRYHEVRVCPLVHAFHHFTRTPEKGASMNQLIEQPPQMVLEARLDPGVGSFLKAQARRGWPAADDQSVEEAR